MYILIVDDHAVFRQGLAILVQEVFPQSLILQGICWADAQHYINAYALELLLLDLFMPTEIGWEQELQILLQHRPDNQHNKICMISSSAEKNHIETAFKLGVSGYICKTAELNEIKNALISLKQGKIHLPKEFWYASPQAKEQSLTVRQQQILKRMAQGDSNKQIARELYLSESTVKQYIHVIYQKLDVNTRAAAVTIAHQRGIL